MKSTTCGVGDLLTDIRATKRDYILSAAAYLNSHQLACEYLRKRSEDARALRAEMTFTFNPVGQLCCTIYDHHVVMNTDDRSVFFRPRNVPQTIAYHSIEQVLAYILAANW